MRQGVHTVLFAGAKVHQADARAGIAVLTAYLLNRPVRCGARFNSMRSDVQTGLHYRPKKLAFLFSTNARGPSLASSVVRSLSTIICSIRRLSLSSMY